MTLKEGSMSLLDGEVVELGAWTYGMAPAQFPVDIPKQPTLPQITRLQDALSVLEQTECPLEHSFGGGMYMRKCSIPADTLVVGKMHRHAHPVLLVKGEATILTNNGMERISAPHQWISQPGAKRPVYTHTDCEFVTVHLSGEETDLAALEAAIIIPEAQIPYEETLRLEEFTEELQRMYA
jgi:hypothetical protein